MRIEAYDDSGNIIYQFGSMRAAGLAGFTRSRLSAAVNSGQRHRGLHWRRCEGLLGLPGWFRTYTRRVAFGSSIPAAQLWTVFIESLPHSERSIERRDFFEAVDRLTDHRVGDDIRYREWVPVDELVLPRNLLTDLTAVPATSSIDELPK